MYFDQLLTFKH